MIVATGGRTELEPGQWSSIDIASLDGPPPGVRTAVVVDRFGAYEAVGVSELLVGWGVDVTVVTPHRMLGPRILRELVLVPALDRMQEAPGRFHLVTDVDPDAPLPEADLVVVIDRQPAPLVTGLPDSQVTVVGDAAEAGHLWAAIRSGNAAGRAAVARGTRRRARRSAEREPGRSRGACSARRVQRGVFSAASCAPRRSGDHTSWSSPIIVPASVCHSAMLIHANWAGLAWLAKPVERAARGLQPSSEVVGDLDLETGRVAVDPLHDPAVGVDQWRVDAVAHQVPGEHAADERAPVPVELGEQQELLVGRGVAVGVGGAGAVAVLGSHRPGAVAHADRVDGDALTLQRSPRRPPGTAGRSGRRPVRCPPRGARAAR